MASNQGRELPFVTPKGSFSNPGFNRFSMNPGDVVFDCDRFGCNRVLPPLKSAPATVMTGYPDTGKPWYQTGLVPCLDAPNRYVPPSSQTIPPIKFFYSPSFNPHKV